MLSEANFIEGIGDEIVVSLGVCLAVFVIFVAWISTRVRGGNRPLTILVFQTLHRHVLITSTPNSGSSPAAVPANPSEAIVQDSERTTASTSVVPTIEVDVMTSTDGIASPIMQDTNMVTCDEQLSPLAFGEGPENTQLPVSFKLKLKYLDEREKMVMASPTESIANFKRKHFEQELSENKSVRLIFRGRELKETTGSCLSHYGLTDESTIHCLVTKRRQTETGTIPGASEIGNQGNLNQVVGTDDMDVSGLMFPIFGVLLAVVWYCRVSYRQYFNVLSTFALVGITVLFFVAGFTCWTFRVAQRDYRREELPPIRIHHINVQR